MKMDKELEDKLAQLQLLEQNLQNSIMQKQMFQSQLMEIENAVSELDKNTVFYRIIGPIMVASRKEDIRKDLNAKKEIVELRIKNLEKQEKGLKEKADGMQAEVMERLKNAGKAK